MSKQHDIKELESELQELRQRVDKLESLLAAAKAGSNGAKVCGSRFEGDFAGTYSGDFRGGGRVPRQARFDPANSLDRRNSLGDAGSCHRSGFARN